MCARARACVRVCVCVYVCVRPVLNSVVRIGVGRVSDISRTTNWLREYTADRVLDKPIPACAASRIPTTEG